MKKYLIVMSIIAIVVVFTNCNPSKKTTSTPDTTTPVVAKLTYSNEVSTVIMNNCSPCHIPSKGGNKKAYDNYANTKADIDEIIRRITLNPTDKGFMPFKHPKLPDSTIAVFTRWKADGMLQ